MDEKSEKLGDFPKIVQNLDVWDKLTIRALHIFLYNEEGDDDHNRIRVANFTGFNYNVGDEKFVEKLKIIKEKLSEPDLVSICAILNIPNYAKDLSTYIFNNLLAGKLLKYHDPNQLNEIDLSDYIEDDEESDSEESDNYKNPKQTVRGNVSKEIYLVSRNKHSVRQPCSTLTKKYEKSSDLPKEMERFIEMILSRFNVNFKDVEDIIRPFSGSSDFPVEWWVKEFEETAINLKLNDVQKFVFGKKSLKGIAKLFIEAEKGIHNWVQLKSILMQEFKTRMSPMKLHDMLKERKKKRNESATEYYFQMKRIAKYSSLEEGDLMQYTIDGLPDDDYKVILQGAKSIAHFREKLRDYDLLRDLAANSQQNIGNGVKEKKLSKGIKAGKQIHLRCFSCGILGHMAAECRNSAERKCELCNTVQSSVDCGSSDQGLNTLLPENYYRLPKKEVTIRGNPMSALVDSGSPLNLINETSYRRIGNPDLNNTGLLLQGFGKAKVLPVGYFEDKIEIDDDIFKTRFYVVSDDVLKTDMIIGNTLLDDAEFIFRKDEIFIRKIRSKEENAVTMQIDIRDPYQSDPEPIEQEPEEDDETDAILANLDSILAGNDHDIPPEDEAIYENIILQRIVDEQEIIINNFQNEIEIEKRQTLELQRVIGRLEEEFKNLSQLNNQLGREGKGEGGSQENDESVAAVKNKAERLHAELMESRIKIQLQQEKLLDLNVRLEEKERLIQNYIERIESLGNYDYSYNDSEADMDEMDQDIISRDEIERNIRETIEDSRRMFLDAQSGQIELGNDVEALGSENAEAMQIDLPELELEPEPELEPQPQPQPQPSQSNAEDEVRNETRRKIIANIESILAGNDHDIPPEDEVLYENIILQKIVDEQEVMITNFENEIENEKRETMEMKRLVNKLEEEFKYLSQLDCPEEGEEADDSVVAAKNKIEALQTDITDCRNKIQLQQEKLIDLNVRLEEKEHMLLGYIQKIESLGNYDSYEDIALEEEEDNTDQDFMKDLRALDMGRTRRIQFVSAEQTPVTENMEKDNGETGPEIKKDLESNE